MSTAAGKFRVVKRDDGTPEFERIVMGEVLIPDIPNAYGDIYTREAIREFVTEFARQGFGIDINHNQVDVQGDKAFIIENFIARPGDPDFIEGSWVVGMMIPDDETWQMVLDGDINGYSFEALCDLQPIVFQNLKDRQVSGFTEPDPIDGHTHEFLVILDVFNRPIAGGTGVTALHSHTIATHTVTQNALTLLGRDHSHRYQVIVAGDGEGDSDEP